MIAAEELPVTFSGWSVVGFVTGRHVEGVFRYPDNALFFTELPRIG